LLFSFKLIQIQECFLYFEVFFVYRFTRQGGFGLVPGVVVASIVLWLGVFVKVLLRVQESLDHVKVLLSSKYFCHLLRLKQVLLFLRGSGRNLTGILNSGSVHRSSVGNDSFISLNAVLFNTVLMAY